jgi:hypothetical protein
MSTIPTVHQKIRIVESLDSLDRVQAEKVLEYIKNLLYTPKEALTYERFKREAINEIRKALNSDKDKHLIA